MTVTLEALRQRVARELGGALFVGTVGSGSTTTALIDDKWPILSNLDQGALYEDWFVYRPDVKSTTVHYVAIPPTLDKERIVKEYDPTMGALVPDTAWFEAPVENEQYELHGVIQPTRIEELINTALKRLLVPVEFTLTPTEDAIRHNLTARRAWLVNPEWVCQVGWLDDNDDRDEIDPFDTRRVSARAVLQDGAVYLEHRGRTFHVTDTLYIRAMKPAYNHCRHAGEDYGDRSGLSADSDDVPIDETWAVVASLVEAWREYGQQLEQAASQRLMRTREECAQWLTAETRKHSHPWDRTSRIVRQWGPRW